MRVLIVKTSSMGDVVHAQPLAADLRRSLPHARIEWVVEPAFAPIVRLNPAIDDAIDFAWRRWRKRFFSAAIRAEMVSFYAKLTELEYDLILDCQGLLKSAVVTRLAPAAVRVGPAWASAREPLASLAYGRRVVVPRNWHVVRRNRAIGAAAGGYPIDSPPHFGLDASPITLTEAPWLPAGRHTVLVTGASRAEKLWPESQWVEIAVRLQREGLALVWIWGSGPERERADRLARLASAAAGGSATGYAVPPFLSIGEAARVLRGAALVIGLDTGFTHLAGALGRPTIGIFCDFDAVQCAVSGDAFCASLGGIGMIPPTLEVISAIEHALAV